MYRGLLLFWNEDWHASIKFFSNGHIDASIMDDKGNSWCLTGFYENPKASLRHFSWDLLRRLQDMRNEPWIVGGDFNKVTSLLEKIGGNDRSVSAMVDFRVALSNCGLMDVRYSGPMITWHNKQVNGNYIQERLDRFVIISVEYSLLKCQWFCERMVSMRSYANPFYVRC